MTFAAVSWQYKDVVTSAKLAQMVENVRAHDHRPDGSQGSPLGVIFDSGDLNVTPSTTVNASVAVGTFAIPATVKAWVLWTKIVTINAPTGSVWNLTFAGGAVSANHRNPAPGTSLAVAYTNGTPQAAQAGFNLVVALQTTVAGPAGATAVVRTWVEA